MYIGSADMMHRNLDRRVEALVRIADPRHLTELAELFDLAFDDRTSRWDLCADGRWVRHHQDEAGAPLTDLQAALIERHDKRRKARGGEPPADRRVAECATGPSRVSTAACRVTVG